MGAHNIDSVLKGHLDEEQLHKWLRRQQREDRDYNGHRDGYSGDWQTIPGIRLDFDFDGTKEQAFDYCLDNSEKWEFAVAVHTVNKKGEPVTVIAGWAAS